MRMCHKHEPCLEGIEILFIEEFFYIKYIILIISIFISIITIVLILIILKIPS